MVYCKSDTILFADAHLKLQKISIEIYGLGISHCLSSVGCTYEVNIFENKQGAEYNREKEKIF